MNRALVFVVAGLIYIVWPFDAMPDFLGVVGWVDDLFVAAVTLYYAAQMLKKRVTGGEPAAGKALSNDPYELLGIPPQASKREIKEAYRREMAKYHPDKVEHLGEEFRRMAENKAKAIQEAYERLLSR